MVLIDCKNVVYQKKKKEQGGPVKIIRGDLEVIIPAAFVCKNGRLKKTKVKKLLKEKDA